MNNMLSDHESLQYLAAAISTFAIVGAWDTVLRLIQLSQIKYLRMTNKCVYIKPQFRKFYDLRGEKYGIIVGKYYDDYMERDKVNVRFEIKSTKEEKELYGGDEYRTAVYGIPIKFLDFKKGGEYRPSKAKFMKMPKIFKWAIALAIVVLVWKFVLNVEIISTFLLHTFLGK